MEGKHNLGKDVNYGQSRQFGDGEWQIVKPYVGMCRIFATNTIHWSLLDCNPTGRLEINVLALTTYALELCEAVSIEQKTGNPGYFAQLLSIGSATSADVIPVPSVDQEPITCRKDASTDHAASKSMTTRETDQIAGPPNRFAASQRATTHRSPQSRCKSNRESGKCQDPLYSKSSSHEHRGYYQGTQSQQSRSDHRSDKRQRVSSPTSDGSDGQYRSPSANYSKLRALSSEPTKPARQPIVTRDSKELGTVSQQAYETSPPVEGSSRRLRSSRLAAPPSQAITAVAPSCSSAIPTRFGLRMLHLVVGEALKMDKLTSDTHSVRPTLRAPIRTQAEWQKLLDPAEQRSRNVEAELQRARAELRMAQAATTEKAAPSV